MQRSTHGDVSHSPQTHMGDVPADGASALRARAMTAVPVVLALFVVMTPMAALAQSENMVGESAAFDALDEPRWISITTTESGSTYALVASYLDNAVQVIDVTDPTNPVPVASLRDGEGGFEALEGGNAIWP